MTAWWHGAETAGIQAERSPSPSHRSPDASRDSPPRGPCSATPLPGSRRRWQHGAGRSCSRARRRRAALQCLVEEREVPPRHYRPVELGHGARMSTVRELGTTARVTNETPERVSPSILIRLRHHDTSVADNVWNLTAVRGHDRHTAREGLDQHAAELLTPS